MTGPAGSKQPPTVVPNAPFTQIQGFRFAWSVLTVPDRWRFAGKQVSAVALSLLGAAPPLLVRMLLDSVVARRGLRSLELVVALGAVVYLLLAVAGVADQWLQSRITEGLGLALRERFFAKTLRLPFAFFVHSRSGSLVSRLTVDIRSAQRIMQHSGAVGSSVVSFSTTFAIMLWLSPTISLIVLSVTPLVLLADHWFARRIATQSRRQLGANASLASFVVERLNVAGALFVRTSGDMSGEAAAFDEHSRTVWSCGIRAAVLNRAYYGVLAVTTGLGILAVLYLGGRQALDGSIRLGTLVALAQYAGQSYQPITRLARTRMQILNSTVALGRLHAYLETPEHVPGALAAASADRRAPAGAAGTAVEAAFPDKVSVEAAAVEAAPAPVEAAAVTAALLGEVPVEEASVEFDRVWFRYPRVHVADTRGDALPVVAAGHTSWILREVSFRARPGERIAIVGESGVGKTSIGYLLAGLFPATHGTVRLGGRDIAALPAALVRGWVGLVTQEAFLFSGTVLDNIRHGRPDASDQEVFDACAAAGADEAIRLLPDGYRTIVGERGFRLSGGQKQRVSLARALLSGARVVLLDEATSHLDAAMDDRIQRDLMAARPDRVLIVIAHRLSTVAHADQILVVRGGRIVERGRHHELAGRQGAYSALFHTQRFAGEPLAPEERKPV